MRAKEKPRAEDKNNHGNQSARGSDLKEDLVTDLLLGRLILDKEKPRPKPGQVDWEKETSSDV
jgi:hypothetical protein